MSTLVLEVNNLKVHFDVHQGTIRALDGVSFKVKRGQTLGIIGESGSGKSVTARAIMQLLAKNGRIVDGEIILHQTSKNPTETKDTAIALQKLEPDSKAIRQLRGKEIAMIFQEPMSSLTPVYTAGVHLDEAIRLHLKPGQSLSHQMVKVLQKTKKIGKKEARMLAIELLARVGIPRAEQQVDSYPHQLSGGQRQRVMIAIALSCNPSLLIADEPTTALDVTTQAQINDLIREIQEEYNMAVIYITHDLGVIAEVAQEVAVMYLGRIIETGDIESIFYHPQHPYTRDLLRSIPKIGQAHGEMLESIKGMVPDPFSIPQGCPFHDRCRDVMPGICEKYIPDLVQINSKQTAACLKYDENLRGAHA